MNIDAPEMEDLLAAAASGEPGAVDRLLVAHRELLHRAIGLRLDRRVSARLDVSDVVQETCLEATRRLPEYLVRRPMPFALWLRWLAREQVLAVHRRHLLADKRTVRLEALPLPLDSSAQFVGGLIGKAPTASQALATIELAERLRLALGQLDDDEREIILWRHFEQLTNREIAQLLEITEAAAGKRYLRALERLRGLLVNLGISGPV